MEGGPQPQEKAGAATRSRPDWPGSELGKGPASQSTYPWLEPLFQRPLLGQRGNADCLIRNVMNRRRRGSLRFPKKDAVLKRTDNQEPGETAGQKCGTADRQSEKRKGKPGHGQSPCPSRRAVPRTLNTPRYPWFHRQ